MPIQLRLTNGTLLPRVIQDKTVDDSQASISFIGRGWVDSAGISNLNLLHMLENFSGPAYPNNPLVGQIWFDENRGLRLQVGVGKPDADSSGWTSQFATVDFVASSIANVSTGAITYTATGDITGVSSGTTFPLTLRSNTVTPGTYSTVVVNSKGLVIAGNYTNAVVLANTVSGNYTSVTVATNGLVTNGNNYIYLDPNTHFVGLGNTAPDAQLTISSASNAIALKMNIGSGYLAYQNNQLLGSQLTSTNIDLTLGTTTTNSLTFVTNNISRMTLLPTGNVGIGKIPTHTLDVNGSFAVSGASALSVTTATTPALGDNSTNVATTAFVRAQIRTRLTANIVFYVNPATGNDTTFNGQSPATPFLTLQHAWNNLQNNYDLAGYTATISCANGVYTTGVTCAGNVTGAVATGTNVYFVGNLASPSSCIINVTNANAFSFSNGFVGALGGFKINASGTISGQPAGAVLASQCSVVNVVGAMVYGACGQHIVSAQESVIVIAAPYTIVGGANYHYLITGNSIIIVVVSNITVVGALAFAYFTLAQYNSSISISGTFIDQNGSAVTAVTGTKYIAKLNAVINTNGAGVSYFPGDSAGATFTGGVYT